MAASKPRGALAGIRVLDLSTVLLGPYATLQLADLGADVIKVEPPAGDTTRFIGPARHAGMSGIFLNLNRNKRSIVLDLKQPAGRKALLRLAATADIFIHAMRPRAIAALGLDDPAVRAHRPDIVYCAAVGFGSAGPLADAPAYDDLIQAGAGMAALLGQVHEGPPAYVPTVLADKVVGLTAANAMLAALLHRERTGQGQYLEVPMYETLAAFLLVEHLYGASFEPPLGPVGYERLLQAARKPFRAADGYLAVMPYTDRQWQSFFQIAGTPAAADDRRFASIGERTRHIGELYAWLEQTIPTRTVAQWRKLLSQAQIPNAAVNSLDDLLSDEQIAASRLLQLHHHPTEGTLRRVEHPVRFSATPARHHYDAPRLGEQGNAVLAEAGFNVAEIEQLRADRVLLVQDPIQ